ncbi:MAG: RiPP maturation radical SAM C-methyltransferase [Candidatus Eremiobacteraeota bacterium]|nr:RiPP maturation radical SAM C-methyltransferase [Candidatus Eremiobacteraeota bacterium]
MNKSNTPTTAIITTPFAPSEGPSIQMGLLKSCLQEAGFLSDDFYFNIQFFHELKKNGCHNIYNSTLPALVSEWLFSPVPFSQKKGIFNFEAYSRLEAFASATGITMDKLFQIKEEIVPRFIGKVVDENDWTKYSAACFTLSYAQINASFAVARRIKEVNPHIKTIFGGAFSQIHDESCPEFMRVFDFIDYFVLGDAEPVITPLIKSIIEDVPVPDLPGIFYRNNREIKTTGGVSFLQDMNKSPAPDYAAYFKLYRSLEYGQRFHHRRYMPIEMSRGCIWGQHKPCTFCAFYPCRDYRPKSPEKIESEINKQIDTNNSGSIYIVDAAVTPEMIENVFPVLSKSGRKIDIPFLELRANVKEKHIKMMKSAGVNLIQPGIECLDNGLLKKINKGVTLFSNLLFLKWCRKYDIRVSYNIILGIPDATMEELQGQLDVIKLIPHLDPPYPMPLSLVRFSDYYLSPERHNLKNLQPDRFYRHIYPKEIDIEKIAFEYTADYITDTPHLLYIYRRSMQCIARWRKMWSGIGEIPFLTLKEERDRNGDLNKIIITDGRKSPRKPMEYVFEGMKAEIYILCMNRPRNPSSIKRRLPEKYGEVSEDEIKSVLDEFGEEGLTVTRSGLSLALAVDCL